MITDGYANVPILTPETIRANHLHGSDVSVWYGLCTFAAWKRINGKLFRTIEGSCFPTIRAIAERCGCTERSVKLSLKKLESIGLVVRAPRRGEDGEQRSNDYTLFADPQP